MKHLIGLCAILASTLAFGFTVENGATNVITYFSIRQADGTMYTGLDPNDFDLYYIEDGAAISAKVDATGHSVPTAAHSDNTACEMGQGEYRVDWPDAAFDGGIGKRVKLIVVYDTDLSEYQYVELSPPANVDAWNGTAVATPDTAGYPKVTVKDGTGTGEIDTALGKVYWAEPDVLAFAYRTVSTSIASVTSTTVFKIRVGAGWPYDTEDAAPYADIYNGSPILVIDNDTGFEQFRYIVDYAADGTVTLDRALSFTPAAEDLVMIGGLTLPGKLYADSIDANALAADAATEINTDLLATTMEGDYTLAQLIRLIAAVQLGEWAKEASEDGTTYTLTYTGVDGSTTRVVGTVTSTSRTISTLEGDE